MVYYIKGVGILIPWVFYNRVTGHYIIAMRFFGAYGILQQFKPAEDQKEQGE